MPQILPMRRYVVSTMNIWEKIIIIETCAISSIINKLTML